MQCQAVHPESTVISSTNAIVLSTVSILVLIANLMANGLLLYSVKKLRFLSSISYKFILSLIICDILVALMGQPMTVAVLLIPNTSSNVSCNVRLCAEFLAFLFCECSGILVMNITIDRYLHMKYLQNYNTYMTSFRAKVMIVSTWIFSATVAGIFVVSSIYNFLFIYHTTILIVNLPIISLNFVLYARAFLALRERVKQMAAYSTNLKTERADLLFAKAVAFILLSLIVCYTPYFALETAWLYLKYVKKTTPSHSMSVAVYWSIIFIHSSSLLSPIILIFSNSESKVFIKDLCSKFSQCFRSEEAEDEVAKPGDYGSTVTLSSVVLSRKFDS